MPPFLIDYQCVSCGKTYPGDSFQYTCPACGANLDARYDYVTLSRSWSKKELSESPERSLWRYLPLLPVQSAPERRSLQVGGTPLVRGDSLGEQLGLAALWFKDDTRNPSGSLKDRATDVGLQHAREWGSDVVVAASTGNAGSSLACLAAWYGRRAVIFVPEAAPPAKLTQILQYGAFLCSVSGSYDEAFDLSVKVGEAYGWYSRSTGINPMLSEGKKTVALEIGEQLGWKVPDQVFVPVGDGCILGGVYKGFYDLLQMGWIDRLPRLVAVQAEGSAAVVEAWKTGDLRPVQARTVADSIAVDFPRDGAKALRAVRESEGYGLTVSDEELLAAQHTLARTTGIFAEPAGAAALAGLLRAREQGLVKERERVVVLVTGSGLKDIPAARKIITIPPAIAPDLTHFQKQWERTHEKS